MPTTRWTRAVPALPSVASTVVSLVLVGALGACSSDGQDAAEPAGSTSTSPSANPSANPSTSPSSSPSTSPSVSAPASPSVTPAVGRTVETYSMTFVVPEGFEGGDDGVGNALVSSVQITSDQRGCIISTGGVANLDLADFEKSAAQAVSTQGGTRQPDREVGGEQVYVITKQSKTERSYYIGRVAGDQVADLSFTFYLYGSVRPEDATPESDQALVESILATVQWKR